MTKKTRIKTNKKEEPKIILFTAIICAVLCVFCSLLSEKAVDSWIRDLDEQTIIRQASRNYLETIEGGLKHVTLIETDVERSPDYPTYVYYSIINDKSADLRTIIGSIGAKAYSTRLCHYGVATWVADRETREKVGGHSLDYVIFGEDTSTRFPADMHATYSDEELHRLCEYYNLVNNSITYIEDIRTYELIYPHLEKYVYREGIAYPLVITISGEDGNNVSFCADKQFDYDPSEVIEADNCLMYDDLSDPLDPTYQLALNLSEEQYGFLSRVTKLPIEQTFHTRGIIRNTIIATTDEHVLCMAEVTDYRVLLNAVNFIGCSIIVFICALTSLILCLRARRRRHKAEYERSVTNALAHNYKSSLMIVRSCAENLIAGVSEEKKTQYEQKIIDETDRMNESTEKILSFYRTGAAGYKPASDQIDAGLICRELIGKYESTSESRNLKWEVDDKEKFSFEGDAVLFTMAMDNLIGNAAKYALSGSTVNIKTRKDGLTLENIWKPIDKFIKKPKRFFEAFVTGDDTPGRSNSGLGLSVAKDLLERMGIKISAKADSEKVSFEIGK